MCDDLMTANQKSLLSMVAFKKVGDSILTVKANKLKNVDRSHYLSNKFLSFHGMWNLLAFMSMDSYYFASTS